MLETIATLIDHCRFLIVIAILELRTCKQHLVSLAPTQKETSLGVRLSVLEIPIESCGRPLGLSLCSTLVWGNFNQE